MGNPQIQLNLPATVQSVVQDLWTRGFRTVVVGGAVRDALLGSVPKDFDFEVYGATYDELAAAISAHGRADVVGKSFGVVKLTAGGETYDFSIPRRDNKIGFHHRDFQATFDPAITPKEAASRRDFTINAIAWDPLAGELLDFFDGIRDLRARILRATSDAFPEDPLRVLRGMQFACRFDLTLDPATAELARSIADQYSTLARERVAEEFMKWATKSVRPGRIFEYLDQSGWMRHFPEIAALNGVPQDSEWHPEGNVDIHTGFVLDEATRVAERDQLQGDDRAVLLFAALAHDFAKATTTELRERGGRMRWSSYGHETEGGPMSRAFLERIGIKASIVEQVQRLTQSHMVASSIGVNPTPRAVRRLAQRLAPAPISQLLRLIEADASGRPPLAKGLPEGGKRIKEVAESVSVIQGPPAPLILGRHVLPYFENRPGRHIGEVTAAAYEAQLDGEFSDEEEALRWLARRFS